MRLPYSIVADPKTNRVFVSSVYSNALKIIDGATNTVTSLKAVSADAMAINASAGLLYLMSYESPQLTVFDIVHRTFSKLPMGANHLWAIARNPVTNVLYVTRIGNADIVAYNENLHTSTIIPTGNYPAAIAVNPRTNRIYVVNYADESVTVIDGAVNRALATIPVGKNPQAIVINEAANEAYVTNVHDDSITLIHGLETTGAETIHVGKHPYGVVVDQTTGTLVTANQGEPSFSRIEASSLPAKLSANASR